MKPILQVVAALCLALLVTATAAGRAEDAIILHRVEVDLPDVSIEFSVFDDQGWPITDLRPGDVMVAEQGSAPRAVHGLTTVVVDTVQDTPPDPGATQPLSTTLAPRPAVVGILIDATTALGGATEKDLALTRALRAVETLLDVFGSRAASRPYLGVFLTSQSPRGPAAAILPERFTRDYRAVDAALRKITPHQGSTALYASVDSTVAATMAFSSAQGSRGLVIVISDGVDVVSATPAEFAISEAVIAPVVSVSIGNPAGRERGRPRLQSLAQSTGGAYLEEPPPDTLALTVLPFVEVVPAVLYQASYRTELYDRGENQTVALHIRLPDGRTLISAAHALPIQAGAAYAGEIAHAHDYLLAHMLRGGLLVLLSAALLALLLGWQRRRLNRDQGTYS